MRDSAASKEAPYRAECATRALTDDGRPVTASAAGRTPAQAVVAANLVAWIVEAGH